MYKKLYMYKANMYEESYIKDVIWRMCMYKCYTYKSWTKAKYITASDVVKEIVDNRNLMGLE